MGDIKIFRMITNLLVTLLVWNPGLAHAETHDCISVQSRGNVDSQARKFGLADTGNIGFVLTYGTSNGSSPDEVAEYISILLIEKHRKMNDVPSYVKISTEAFIDCTDKKGISVAFTMGGLAVGPVDILEAVSDTIIQKVIERRQSTARLLKNGLLTNE